MATEDKPSLLKRIPWFKFLLLGNITCALITVACFWSLNQQSEKAFNEKQALSDIQESTIFKDKPVVFTLDPFTVNLGDDQEKIIQIEIALEMIDEDGFEEVVTMGSHARDTIVNILNGKSYDDISSIQGKLFLKDEIILALNQNLDRSFIKDLYFSRFMIQEI